MTILVNREFSSLRMELQEIEKLIGIEDRDELLFRVQKIIDRLDISKQSRIKKLNLKVIS